MSTIKVAHAHQLLSATLSKDADKILDFMNKKEIKTYKGTIFVRIKWNIPAVPKHDGWFYVENVVLTSGIADPADQNDKRNEYEGTRLQLQTTVSNAGPFGLALSNLNPIWKKAITQWSSKPGNTAIKSRKIHDLLQTHVAESNEKNPGAPIDDPIIRIKLDFKPFPKTFRPEFLAGQPRTQIFDARTAYLDDEGHTQYKLATVKDPKTGKDVLVNENNVHLFVTPGSILKVGRLLIQSVPYSQSWVSMPIVGTRLVIEPGAPAGFDEDFAEISDIIERTQGVAVTPAPTSPATDEPSSNVSGEDLDAVLDAI